MVGSMMLTMTSKLLPLLFLACVTAQSERAEGFTSVEDELAHMKTDQDRINKGEALTEPGCSVANMGEDLALY